MRHDEFFSGKRFKAREIYHVFPGVWPAIFDSFVAVCAKVGFTPPIMHQASQLHSLLRLVESGFGISLLPNYVQNGYSLNVKYVPLTDATESIPLLMLTRKENPNPALLNFKNYLLKQ